MTKQQNNKPNSAFIEDNNVNTSLTWDDKVELELNALKDTTNEINPENILDKVPQTEQMIEQELTWDPIKEKYQDTISLQDEVNNELRNTYKEYKQRRMSFISKKRNEKHEVAEQVPHYAPTPDIVMDDIEVNMSNTEVQTQTVMECPMEEGSQTNTGSSMVTNDTKMGKTELLEKDPISQGAHVTGAPNMEVNTVTQQDSPGVPSLPDYMQGNENLQDELDILSPTGNVAVQSIGHSDPHLLEHILEPTMADETGWLQTEGFIPVV
ncbi:420_t:CDS:2, partial [Gigaspora margarita]